MGERHPGENLYQGQLSLVGKVDKGFSDDRAVMDEDVVPSWRHPGKGCSRGKAQCRRDHRTYKELKEGQVVGVKKVWAENGVRWGWRARQGQITQGLTNQVKEFCLYHWEAGGAREDGVWKIDLHFEHICLCLQNRSLRDQHEWARREGASVESVTVIQMAYGGSMDEGVVLGTESSRWIWSICES